MYIFNKIILLSQQIAMSILKGKQLSDLENIDFFEEEDKDYIIKNLTDPSVKNQRKDLIKHIDTSTDWKKVKNRIIPVKLSYWKYTAAAVFIGLLFMAGLLKNNIFFSDKPALVNIAQNTIQVGTNKAILTLEDGSNVYLEKGKKIQNKSVHSNGEELVYNSSKTNKILKYNYLTIPKGGEFSIKLSDGTQVWLNSDSQLKFPVSFKEGSSRIVELVYGEAYFKVSPSKKHKGVKFKVLNKKQEVEVIGTEFNIKAYPDDFDTYTTLVEGKIALSCNGKKQNLIPNQQSHLNFKTNLLSLKTVNVYNEIAWREGVFSFEGKSLKEIMKVLARWYDIKVHFKDAKTETIEFNGILDKNQRIEEILEIIKNFKVINNYKIVNKTIIIE